MEEPRKEERRKHSHYFKEVGTLEVVDVYRVLSLFKVTDQALGHAIKKLLVAGGRGAGKDIGKDVREAIDTLQRWVEMRHEDAQHVCDQEAYDAFRAMRVNLALPVGTVNGDASRRWLEEMNAIAGTPLEGATDRLARTLKGMGFNETEPLHTNTSVASKPEPVLHPKHEQVGRPWLDTKTYKWEGRVLGHCGCEATVTHIPSGLSATEQVHGHLNDARNAAFDKLAPLVHVYEKGLAYGR